jgi:hypothetical protein
MNEMQYCNELLMRMEELFYQELSDCAGWKTELVGIDFIQAKDIKGSTKEEVIENCIAEIKNAGLVDELEYSISGLGIKLELKVKGCKHMPKEIQLKKNGVKPYICPINNMILDQLIEKLGFETTYVADLEIEEDAGSCRIWSAIYEDESKIGAVCNWNEE